MNDYKIKELYEEMEKELISSMKRNLKRHLTEEEKVGFKYTQWQAEKLKELSRYRRQNKSIIGEYTSGINKEVAKHIQEEVKQGSINAIKQYNKALGEKLKPSKIMNKSFFKTNDRKVNALIKVVNNDLKTANTSALRMINDQYRQVIHKSAFFVGNGVFTEQQAAKMATKELTDLKLAELAIDESNKDFLAGGLNCIQYKGGRRVNIASYSQMAVRTANLRAQLMGEGDFRKSIGRVLVQATSHGGACPICQKWENHIFIDDVYSGGTKEDGKYMLLSEAMKQGFLHPNCRHGLTTYYPELENIENETEEEYQADLDYINERMNYIDRNIKKYDRLSLGSIAPENVNLYKNKKKQWKNELNSLNTQPKFRKLTEKEIENFQTSSDVAYNKFKGNSLDAINEYSMGGYQDINDFLNGKYPDYKYGNEIIKEIDDAMSNYELKDDIIAFKGTSKNHYESKKIGDIINMKMYNSTALNENIAKTFLSEKKNPIMLEIRVPKGTKCLYIGNNSSYEFESELLLGRNLKYKIIDKTEEKIIMEVVK